MSKQRIYEYAKDLNIKSKDVIDELKKTGIEVSNHMQTLEDDQVKALDKVFKKTKLRNNKKSKKILNQITKTKNKVTTKNKATISNKRVKITALNKTRKTTKAIKTKSKTRKMHHNNQVNLKNCHQKSLTLKVLQWVNYQTNSA